MPRLIARLLSFTARTTVALVLTVVVLWLASRAGSAIEIETLALTFAASLLLGFSHTGRMRMEASLFLLAVILVQRGVEAYFRLGVHRHALPWPWHGDAAGTATGSIGPQVGHVAVVSACLLLTAAIGIALWHYRSRPVAARGQPDASRAGAAGGPMLTRPSPLRP